MGFFHQFSSMTGLEIFGLKFLTSTTLERIFHPVTIPDILNTWGPYAYDTNGVASPGCTCECMRATTRSPYGELVPQ